MFEQFERDYRDLVQKILEVGEYRQGRNGNTFSIFGATLVVDMRDSNKCPLLIGRKMFYKGIFGEVAAMLRMPTHINDFKRWGCNYWDQWADKDGNINIDYGNLWRNFNGVDQLSELIDKLKNNPTDRRLLITGWKPDNLDKLSLPCCHLLYQWYVTNDGYLDMMWYQRSAYTMIGIGSDIVFASVMNIIIANEVGLKPGKITFVFGDTHIYAEHLDGANQYIDQYYQVQTRSYPTYFYFGSADNRAISFEPDDLTIDLYNPGEAIKFEVKA